jgi:hypothetical protein
MKKIFSAVLTFAAICSFSFGAVLMLTNIQASRVPDGHPLDPWWLVWGLLLVVPATTGTFARLLSKK